MKQKQMKKSGKTRSKGMLIPMPPVPTGVHIGADGSIEVMGMDVRACEKIATRLAVRVHKRMMTDRMFQ